MAWTCYVELLIKDKSCGEENMFFGTNIESRESTKWVCSDGVEPETEG